jgi:hypothetical protein
MRKNLRKDYVVGLITGQIVNPYPPLKDVMLTALVSEDTLMVKEGLRVPSLHINKEEFKKNSKQKRFLKWLKKKHNNELRFAGINPKKRLNLNEPMVLR